MLGNKIIAGALTTLVLGGATIVAINMPKPIEVIKPKVLVWEKPKTAEEWAEDVKVESFHILTTKALEESVVRHTEKLNEEEKALEKFQPVIEKGEDPVQAIYWEWYWRLKELNPDISTAELQAEALNNARADYEGKVYSVEKLKQSIERMNKEIELRKSGYLRVAEEPTGLFGANVPPERVRHTTLHD